MILTDYYWYFQSALDSDTCDKIIEMGIAKNPALGTINTDKEINQKQIRDSNVSWLDERWIYDIIHPYIHTANEKAGWNFQWDFTQSAQFTVYRKGQYYDWHPDQNHSPYNDKHDQSHRGKIRKLSVTISLNDGSEYEGGELEFDFGKSKGKQVFKTCTEIKPKGSIVVFPSFVYHRVLPVTSGTRYSLVMWNLGYPYK